MVFNSLSFVFFFSVVLGLFFLVPQKLKWAFLLASSVWFFVGGAGSPLLLLHIALTIAAAYWLGQRIDAESDAAPKRRWLQTAIVLLGANLFVFKYTGFTNESLRSVASGLGLSYPVPVIQMLLPLGISFYTFQLISYVVDVYKGMKAERHFGVFALYVMFFPKFLAGPIERAKNLLPQLHVEQHFDYDRISAGLQLMLWGAFQKVVVADRVALFVNEAYADPRAHTGATMVFATWLFAFQVYCDFAGYTNMAIGAAQTLGYKLSPNFNRPYFATSVQDFWKRWHISLTSWLTDYIYTPLTRTKKIKLKWYYLMLLSLLFTFVFSGLWHGANWTFVAWGTLHGIYLVTATMTQKWRTKIHKKTGLIKRKKLHNALKVMSTFALVCFAYILFQAKSIADAAYIIGHLHTGWADPAAGVSALIDHRWAPMAFGVLGIAVVVWADATASDKLDQQLLNGKPRWVRWTANYACAAAIAVLGAFEHGNADFIYVQF